MDVVSGHKLSHTGRKAVHTDIVSSRVNLSLKFQTLVSQICQYFCRKNLRSFCSAKAFFLFFQQKISVYLVIRS